VDILLARLTKRFRQDPPVTYWLTRVVFLRFLGLIYFVGFLSISQQFLALVGEKGLYPVGLFLPRVHAHYGTGPEAFRELPTLFWLDHSDGFLQAMSYVGVTMATVLLLGFANVPLMAGLWALYMSFYHVGQLFYGYGWELLLLETGFLAIFLCPLVRMTPLPRRTPPSPTVIRNRFGAGLIKIRGDACWRDLTCLVYHYETQPIPNPVSWYLHHLPAVVHEAGVLFNHFAELIVPWLLFAPRPFRHVAGIVLVLFQLMLIVSGNLSWLNWLTIALCIPCFDDTFWRRFVPQRVTDTAAALGADSRVTPLRRVAIACVACLVAYLSRYPIENMISSRQAMNRSFDSLHLVNTYGAFGSVGTTRTEIVLQGTYDDVLSDDTEWLEYEFTCKPGDPMRRPCVISPYHLRLDWQIWFAAMADFQRNLWLVHFVAKLLEEDPGALGLIERNPFDRGPPKHIRAEHYRYRFSDWDDDSGAWWRRERIGSYMPPLSADHPGLLRFLERYGWR
jgi:hypothetical protein